jgi:hypothetical protein
MHTQFSGEFTQGLLPLQCLDGDFRFEFFPMMFSDRSHSLACAFLFRLLHFCIGDGPESGLSALSGEQRSVLLMVSQNTRFTLPRAGHVA